MAKRNAQGSGSIRQRKDGTWEARYTTGRNPATGKQVQKSLYGKTQKEVLQKLRQVQSDIDSGTFVEPSKMTLGQWAETWLEEYMGNLKQYSRASYSGHIRKHIQPKLGAVALQKLQPHQVQTFYNDLEKNGLSPKTIKNIHGTLHGMLAQAVKLGYIKSNPTEVCTLPRYVKPEIQVLPEDSIKDFLQRIDSHQFEAVYLLC